MREDGQGQDVARDADDTEGGVDQQACHVLGRLVERLVLRVWGGAGRLRHVGHIGRGRYVGEDLLPAEV